MFLMNMWFENGVILYGSQGRNTNDANIVSFENGVILYGSQGSP